MKYVMTFFGLLIVAIIALLAAGYSMPAKTTMTRSVALHKSPEEIFAVLSDMPNMPKWNRNMEKIEILLPREGRETTLQTFKGGMRMTIITTESVPASKLVRTMADEKGPFVGSWSYEISPQPDGARVALTERAEVANPVFRVLMRLFGQTKYMDEHLVDLGKHFGETVQPQ